MAPTHQSGLWSSKDSIAFKKSLPVSLPSAGQVLIKNEVVASNPADWKAPDLYGFSGVAGNDVAGFVEAVGEGVTGFAKGDRVAAMTTPLLGGFQQYSLAPAGTTFKVGAKVSFEDAATLPAAVGTAFMSLYKCLDIKPFYEGTDDAKTIVINGASSSVGAYAVQLAKLSGLFVVATAGSAGTYVSELGADVVVDYRGKSADELGGALKAALKGRIANYFLDAVGGGIAFAKHVFGPSGGRYLTIVPMTEGSYIADNVESDQMWVVKEVEKFPEFASDMYRRLSVLLEEGKLKPNRVCVIPDGLLGVEEALQQLRSGKVSGEKLVHRISETPAL